MSGRTSTIPSVPSSAASVRYRLTRSTVPPPTRQVPRIRASATTISASYYPPFHASGSVSVRYPCQVPRPDPFRDPHVSYYPSQPSSSAAIRPAACQVPPDHYTIPSFARQVPPIPPLSARELCASGGAVVPPNPDPRVSPSAPRQLLFAHVPDPIRTPPIPIRATIPLARVRYPHPHPRVTYILSSLPCVRYPRVRCA